MNSLNQNNLLSFLCDFYQRKSLVLKIKTILHIEAFEKLHKICLNLTAQNKKSFLFKLKKQMQKPRKWLKQTILQSLQLADNLMNFKNNLILKEIFIRNFYLNKKIMINKQIDYKLLKNKDIQPEKITKSTIALIKMHAFRENKNNLRNCLMKYFNRWNYM